MKHIIVKQKFFVGKFNFFNIERMKYFIRRVDGNEIFVGLLINLQGMDRRTASSSNSLVWLEQPLLLKLQTQITRSLSLYLFFFFSTSFIYIHISICILQTSYFPFSPVRPSIYTKALHPYNSSIGLMNYYHTKTDLLFHTIVKDPIYTVKSG